jgi:hypothetical protein
MSTTRGLQREIEAATILREQLKTLGETDDGLARDMIEGETSLFEMIDALVAADGEDAATIDGLSSYIKSLQERKSRIETRSETRRALLASALEIAGLRRHPSPAGTITRKAVAPKAIIIEESDIPTKFFVTPEPRLDKKALGDALKARQAALDEAQKKFQGDALAAELAMIEMQFPPIAGATLSNGSATVQIRR